MSVNFQNIMKEVYEGSNSKGKKMSSKKMNEWIENKKGEMKGKNQAMAQARRKAIQGRLAARDKFQSAKKNKYKAEK